MSGTLLATTGPTWVLISAAGVVGTVVAGQALRHVSARLGTLRATVALASLSGLVLALVVAAAAARLMVLDDAEVRRFLVVLAVAAAFGALLAVVVAGPIARDVGRLGAVAQQVEQGRLDGRTGIARRDEIGAAAHALDQAVARLAQLEAERAGVEAERRVMLTSVGHDLRTPLAALRAAIEAVADGVAGDPGRYLQSMQRDVVALGTLVDDLFLLARIEGGGPPRDREALDLAELADEAVEVLAPVAGRRGVDVRLDLQGTARVEGSSAELGRAIRNLLDNALRHAPSGSTVVLAVAAAGAAGDDHVLAVHDDGPGFPSGFEDHALAAFTRADEARTRTTGGHGLGLAIARGLVEAHGGRVTIGDGPGATVTISLPPHAPARAPVS